MPTLDDALGIHPQAMKLRAYRAQVLASNLANADTPRYQARDVDFERILSGATSAPALSATHGTHFADHTSDGVPVELQYRQPTQPSLDQNTVDVAAERARFLDNALRYQAERAFPGRQVFRPEGRAPRRISMSLFSVFDIAGSALGAQSLRLNVTASNMANANSVSSSIGSTYRARLPVFSALVDEFAFEPSAGARVRVEGVVEDQSPLRREFRPGHPLANDDGYVYLPNVDVVEEMANMISASRTYQTNVEVIDASKQMLQRTLTLGQR